MKRGFRRAITAGLVPLLALAAACTEDEPSGTTGGGDGEEATGPVEMLVIFPETGPLAAVAAETASATTAAVEELWNEEHPDRPVSMRICNDEGNPERSVSCVNRYVDEVDIVNGPHFGAMFQAAAPVADGRTFMTTATPHGFPEPDSTIFQAIPTAEVAMEAAVAYMGEQDWARVGLLTSSDTTGEAARDAALEVAEEHGIEFVDQQFDPSATELTPQVSAIASADVDAVFIWSSGSQVVTALRALKNADLDVPTFLNFSSMSLSLMDLAGDSVPSELLFTGSLAFTPDQIDDPGRRELVERFSELYEEEAGHIPDWSGFSIADSQLVALNAALGGSTPDEMAAHLESGVEIPGLHTVFSYGEDDHLGLPDENPIRIMRWNGSGWDPA
ncbi:MAG TPA: ABC transporter substrate-binding protein [Acidimicrobiales bacterium]